MNLYNSQNNLKYAYIYGQFKNSLCVCVYTHIYVCVCVYEGCKFIDARSSANPKKDNLKEN